MWRSLALAASLASVSLPAVAAQCGDREDILDELWTRHGEYHIFTGTAVGGKAVLEGTLSASGTWTFLVTYTNGVTCLLAHGENFVLHKPVPRAAPEDPS